MHWLWEINDQVKHICMNLLRNFDGSYCFQEYLHHEKEFLGKKIILLYLRMI